MRREVPTHPFRAAVLGVFLCTIPVAGGPAPDTNAWQTVKMEHFVVLHRGNQAFAERMGKRAEELFGRIMRDLGYLQHDRFWLWDNRCTIRIHQNAEAFRQSVRAPEWAAGCADPAKREIATFEGSDAFVERVLPHELTHLVFREFVGFKGEIPLWLNEGVAVWEGARLSGRRLFSGGVESPVPLAALMAPDMRTAGATVASNVYAQAAAVVGFIIERGGAEKFSTFCRQLRDGKTVDDALRFTYGPAMGNIEALERVLRTDREEKQKR
jgi:hypothetical protein